METEPFQNTVEQSNIWLKEIMEKMGWQDRHEAYLAVRAVLQTLRDRLPLNEAAHLGAQLPMLLRGVYYERWDPKEKPLKRSREEFLAAIAEGFPKEPRPDPAEVTRAVFSVVGSHVSQGEVDEVRGQLPEDIRELWAA